MYGQIIQQIRIFGPTEKTEKYEGSGKKIDIMANVSIFSGNFFHFVESEK